MSKQHTSQTPRLLIAASITFLLWFALFGYVRDMPLFQSLFWVDSLLLIWLWIFSYLWTDIWSELDLQKFIWNVAQSLPSTQTLLQKNQKLLARRVAPLFGLWFVRAIIDILVHMHIPRAFRLIALLWWYVIYRSIPSLRRDWPMIWNMQIWWYEIALILWLIIALRLIQQNYYNNIDRLIPASALWWWLLYLMGTYLAGYDIIQLKKFISFWFFSALVVASFIRQSTSLAADRFEENTIERVVYEEKIIYVPEEIDQYEDMDIAEPVIEQNPFTITQISDTTADTVSPSLPTNILDRQDTEWETLAQQLLRLTADDPTIQTNTEDELIDLQ